MEKVFFVRGGKGRIRHLLTVYSDQKQYRLHFEVLNRTNPTKAEKAAGVKEKRFVVLDQDYYVECGKTIIPSEYPLPELAEAFSHFLQGEHEL
jgi:hypothetical protein